MSNKGVKPLVNNNIYFIFNGRNLVLEPVFYMVIPDQDFRVSFQIFTLSGGDPMPFSSGTVTFRS
jgi:hypothetical protein